MILLFFPPAVPLSGSLYFLWTFFKGNTFSSCVLFLVFYSLLSLLSYGSKFLLSPEQRVRSLTQSSKPLRWIPFAARLSLSPPPYVEV